MNEGGVLIEDDKDNFQASLERQYQDLIQEAILDCELEHRTRLNVNKLNSKLKVIHKAAAQDGLSETVVNRLIDQAMPATAAKAA
jgi:hypothetical protein